MMIYYFYISFIFERKIIYEQITYKFYFYNTSFLCEIFCIITIYNIISFIPFTNIVSEQSFCK